MPRSTPFWMRHQQPPPSRRPRSQRRLRAETLESRRLLSADHFHHHLGAEDVNDDGTVTATDALMTSMAMNRQAGPNADTFTAVNDHGQQSAIDALMMVDRMNRGGRPRSPRSDLADPSVPVGNGEVREIDGTGNHLRDLELGSTGQQLLRIAEADYADDVSEPAGADRPSAREISNLLSAADLEGTPNDRHLTAFLYVWGQFIDHDIDLSLNPSDASAEERFDIAVPADDVLFDPTGSGEATIPLTRSAFDPETGNSLDNPRQQVNAITAWVDASMVYGSDQVSADGLREFSGGRLRIRDNGLLPTDADGNVQAGDSRAAENVALTAMQSLWVREHNRLADAIAAEDARLSDEEIYQQARAVVIAEIQAITYHEFLPALLGRGAIADYEGYDADVDPSIATEFSTAAFRFGHSTLNDDVEFFGNDGRSVREEVALADAFFNPALLEETGIDSVLKYDASTLSQEIDLQVVDGIRNFLFGSPGAGGLDLAALNIQRGRDHGLSDYNSTRVAYGLQAYDSFASLTSDVELQEKLETLYRDINNIDLWVGLLAEDHVVGASVGELTGTIIADQFERLRDGDRLWFENVFSGRDLRQLKHTTLADVIERNTGVEGLQENVFFFRAELRGTVSAVDANASGRDSNIAPTDRKGGRRSRCTPQPTGVAGVTIELLSAEGEVIDTTVTDRQGNYRFRSFAETGDYRVRIAAANDVEIVGQGVLDALIASGDIHLRGMDFQVNV